MTTCNRTHPANIICRDRYCYLGNRNPLLTLQRRLDRTLSELRSVRQTVERRAEVSA